MSSNETPLSHELVQLVRLADEAQSLNVLVHAQHALRSAIRRALLLQQWSDLESVQQGLAGSAPLAARFNENLHHVLERPELSAGEPFGRLHGLVLAISVGITCKAGTLASLPEPLDLAFRESLQERFPGKVAIRLVNRLVPQLVAHSMGARSLYELIRELASGGSAAAAHPESQAATAFRTEGRSQGQHHLFALALAPHHEDLAHYEDLETDPSLVKWAAAQTEAITSNFAERGWPLLLRVATPQRLGRMLSSPLSLSDVTELDGLLDHVASRQGCPVTALGADLAMLKGDPPAVKIDVREHPSGTLLARGVYRLTQLGAEAGAYRVAVRLASAGVQLTADDEAFARLVERAVTLTTNPPPSEAGAAPDIPKSRRLGARLFGARSSRSPRHLS